MSDIVERVRFRGSVRDREYAADEITRLRETPAMTMQSPPSRPEDEAPDTRPETRAEPEHMKYRHERPDGSGECDYLGYEVHMAVCNKCGWSTGLPPTEPDAVEALRELDAEVGLHESIEIIYIVDGFEATLTTHDGASTRRSATGATILEALRALTTDEEGDDGRD